MARLRVRVITCGLMLALAGCSGGPSFSELFDESAAAEGTGIQGAGLVRALVILARHKATSQQREVAEQNARRAVAEIQREIAREEAREAVEARKPAPRDAD